jgi:hypothetical protein
MELTPRLAVISAIESKKRLPELEPLILTNPIAACYYAVNVIKGEWKEAEPVIVGADLHTRLAFDTLDETRQSAVYYGNRNKVPRNKNYNKSLLLVYTQLIRKRFTAIEPKLRTERYGGYAYRYAKLIYKLTKELIDLDNPSVCLWILSDISRNKFAKRLGKEERLNILNDLHKRMILHSFSHGDDRNVREYFANKKKTENDFLVTLSQYDENLTVRELIQKITSQ